MSKLTLVCKISHVLFYQVWWSPLPLCTHFWLWCSPVVGWKIMWSREIWTAATLGILVWLSATWLPSSILTCQIKEIVETVFMYLNKVVELLLLLQYCLKHNVRVIHSVVMMCIATAQSHFDRSFEISFKAERVRGESGTTQPWAAMNINAYSWRTAHPLHKNTGWQAGWVNYPQIVFFV